MERTPWLTASQEWGRRWCVAGVSTAHFPQVCHVNRKLFCFIPATQKGIMLCCPCLILKCKERRKGLKMI